MSDENNVQAEAPADDGFIDLDKVEEAVEAPEGEEAEKPAEPDKDKPETAEDDGKEEEEDDKPRKRSGIQRLKARTEHLASELAARERQLEELQRQVTAGDSDDKEPKEADYPDYFAWQRALTAFDTRKVIRDEQRKNATSSIQVERQNLLRDRASAHQERVEAAKEFITDFDKVLNTVRDIALKPEVQEEILSSDKSELISYHLAKNPDKLRALNSMTPRELAKEIGRLEGSVRAPSAKTATSAPPPPSKVNGGASPVNQDAILNSWLAKTYGKR